MARRAITERRIAHIVGKMKRLEWQTGKSGQALAKRWSLSQSSIQKLSAEASKRVWAEIADPELVTLTLTAALDKVLRDALAAGDARTVVKVADTWARIVGATGKSRQPEQDSGRPSLMIFYPAEDDD